MTFEKVDGYLGHLVLKTDGTILASGTVSLDSRIRYVNIVLLTHIQYLKKN